jgi:ribonuclease P protein component
MTPTFTFPKKEHLCGEIRIGKLYAEGKAFIVYPLRVVYKVSEGADNVPLKVLVSVPKKRFKHAVDRNRIKRLMRETYRLNKLKINELATEKELAIQIAFNYVADNEMDFASLNRKMEKALSQIAEKM